MWSKNDGKVVVVLWGSGGRELRGRYWLPYHTGVVKINAHAMVASHTKLWGRCADRPFLRSKFQAPPLPPWYNAVRG